MSSGTRELVGFFSFAYEDADLARKLSNCIEHELSVRTDANVHFWQRGADGDPMRKAIDISVS